MAEGLSPGETLKVDASLESADGFARLTFQADGNLVLYCQRPTGWTARWSTDTWGQPVGKCVLQTDGNLVLYNGSTAVWDSGTWTHPGSRLLLQDDENVVIYDGGTPVWSSNTSLDGTPVKGSGPKVFHLFQGIRHWIPDPDTLEAQFGGWAAVSTLSDAQLAVWPEGDAVPSVLGDGTVVTMCADPVVVTPVLPPRTVPTPPPRILSDGSVIGVSRQPLTGETDKMWDVGQTIRVKLFGGTPFVRGKVRTFAEQWTQYANIHFAWVDPNQDAEVRVTFEAGKGSWSVVGRDSIGVPFGGATMNFGWFTDTTPDSEFSRVVLHEFGHALGLVHEHQSPVAGIPWDREKTYAFYLQTQGWDRAMVDAQVFAKYSVTTTNYSAFDPQSIMEYWVPSSVTLDGSSVQGGTVLSDVDKQYIRKWYPQPPVPGAATGLLRTGDDCDEIDFTVEYGVVPADVVGFVLQPASGLNWWKAIEVPVGAGGYTTFEMQDGRSASGLLGRNILDNSRPIRFGKAKVFGLHTRLGYTWDVIGALPGGSRLTLTWKRDHC